MLEDAIAWVRWLEANPFLLGGGVAGLLGAAALAGRLRRPPETGAARLATAAEVRKAGLMGNRTGVVVGKWGRQPLLDNGDGHVLLVGPTRSGKDQAHNFPTTRGYRGSMLILDVKEHGENWKACGAARAAMGPVYVFAPSMRQSHSIDLSAHIRWGQPEEFRDVSDLVRAMMEAREVGEQRQQNADFFKRRGTTLLRAAMLHAGRFLPRKSMAGVVDFLVDEQVCVDALKGSPAEDERQVGQELASKGTDERSGYFSNALDALDIFRDPLIVSHTERCDVRFTDLQFFRDAEGKRRPVTLYFVAANPEQLNYLYPLFRAVLVQIISVLRSIDCDPRDRAPLLNLYNEFPSLGYLEPFEGWISTAASSRMRFLLPIQDLDQLFRTWGERTAIWGNTSTKVFHQPENDRTAKRLVEMVGEREVDATSTSHGRQGKSVTVSKRRQDVLTMTQLMGLGRQDLVLKAPGCPYWIRAKKHWRNV